MKKNNVVTFLIDLDMILDTRLGTLTKVNPKWVELVLSSGNYHNRPNDDFGQFHPSISTEAYNEAWKTRDKVTLSLSRPTNFLLLLNEIIEDVVMNILRHPTVVSEGTVLINCYPYQLSHEECFGIVQCVKGYIGDVLAVKVCNIPPSGLTPVDLANMNITRYFLYDFQSWMDALFEGCDEASGATEADLPKGRPSVDIVVPKFIRNLPTPALRQELKSVGLENEDPFEVLSTFMAYWCCITFLGGGLFSLLQLTDNPTKPTHSPSQGNECTLEDIENALQKGIFLKTFPAQQTQDAPQETQW